MTAQTAKQKAANAASSKDTDNAESKVSNENKVEVYLSKTVQFVPGAEPSSPAHTLLLNR